MRLLLPIFALAAIIAHQRPDWLRGLSSAGGRAATGHAGLGSRFGLGPGRGIGAARAKAVEPGEPSAPLSQGQSVEGRQDAVAEVPQDAATTRDGDPDLPRSTAATIAGCGPMDGTRGMHEPRARFEQAREQPVQRPPSGGDISELQALASGNGEERRVGGVANEAVFQSTQGGAESQRQLAQNAMRNFDDVGSKAAEAVLGAAEDAPRPAALPSAAEGGLRDLQQSMAGLVEGVVRTNLRVAQEVFRMSDPAAVVELQQRFLREYMDALLQGGATLARAVRRTADETLRPMEQQIEQRGQANENDRRFTTAAE